jgi:hypothetical protein
MALQLNLLHEELAKQRQRQRDPLKLGLIALGAVGAMLFLYYGWNAYQTLQIRSELKSAETSWNQVEPKVTAAQKRADELRKIIDSTKVLDGIIDSRFYWAPFLGQLSQTVSPNIQIVSLEGHLNTDDHSIAILLEGISAAREPRAAAEDFRELLFEQLEKNYANVKIDFKTLEDLDTTVILAGAPNPSSRFILSITFLPKNSTAGATAAPPARSPKKQ